MRSTNVGQLGLAACALGANNVGQHGCTTGWIMLAKMVVATTDWIVHGIVQM